MSIEQDGASRRRVAYLIEFLCFYRAHLQLDPTREEQEGAQATVSLALETNPSTAVSEGSVEGEAVVTSTTRGAMAIEEYLDALDRCRMASRTINAFARLSLDKAQRRSELPGT